MPILNDRVQGIVLDGRQSKLALGLNLHIQALMAMAWCHLVHKNAASFRDQSFQTSFQLIIFLDLLLVEQEVDYLLLASFLLCIFLETTFDQPHVLLCLGIVYCKWKSIFPTLVQGLNVGEFSYPSVLNQSGLFCSFNLTSLEDFNQHQRAGLVTSDNF